MKSLFKNFFIIASFLIIFIPNIAFGDTYISGIIDTNQTWSKTNSPYYLSNIYIEPNATVSIDPGVKVYVDGYIAVFGSLNVNGGINNIVNFDLDPNASSWEVYVGDTGKLNLNNSSLDWVSGVNIDSGNLSINDTVLSNMFTGIIGVNNSKINVNNLNINNLISGTAITVVSGSELTLSNSRIEDSLDNDNYLIAGYQNSNVNINDSELVPILSIPIIMVGGELNISGLTIDGGLNDGINLFPNNNGTFTRVKANIKNTHISNFGGDGLFAIDPDIIMSNSVIVGNNTGLGLIGRSDFDVSVSQSTIISNSTGVFFANQNPGLQIEFDIKNNWWGDASGPNVLGFNDIGIGDNIIANNSDLNYIEFSPWLFMPPNASCCSNILFLPGLKGSRLYTKDLLENQLWEPNRNADVSKLNLNKSGQPINSKIYTRDIIERTNIGLGLFDQDIYKNFSLSMNELVSGGIINEWKPFPYDWRFDYIDLINNGIKLQNQIIKIIPEVERLSATSKSGKVTIITHSNGGLFAKVLIKKLSEIGKSHLIDNLIMVAAPQLGTPDSIGALLHGDNQDIRFILNKSTMRSLGENMKSAYNLLPSKKYFDVIEDPVIVFDKSLDSISNLRTKYGNDITEHDSFYDFLLASDGRSKPSASNVLSPNILNSQLLTYTDNLHTILDSWVIPQNIKLTEIAGWGISTSKGYKYLAKNICLPSTSLCVNAIDHESIKTIDGDGTVVSPSAIIGNGDKYYVNIRDYNRGKSNIDHANILEIPNLEILIKSIIQNNSTTTPEFITKDKPTDESDSNIKISMHSPVSLDIYDDMGRHTGIVTNPNPQSDVLIIEKNIPNSVYEEVGEGKYIYIDAETNKTIKLKGLDYGTFSLNIQITNYLGEVSENSFVDVPTNTNMLGTAVLSTTTTKLLLDVEGDGKNDVVLDSGAGIDAITYLTIIKKTISGFDYSIKIKTDITNRIDAIIKLINSGTVIDVDIKIKDFNDKIKTAGNTVGRRVPRRISRIEAQKYISKLIVLLNSLESK